MRWLSVGRYRHHPFDDTAPRDFRVNIEAENKRLEEARRDDPSATNTVSVKVTNPVFSGKKIADMKKLCTNRFVISRIMHPDGTVDIAAGHSVINLDDVLYMVVSAKDSARVASFIGEEVTVDDDKWREENQKYVSRRIVITKPQINGRYLGDLKLRNNFGVERCPGEPCGYRPCGNSQPSAPDGRPAHGGGRGGGPPGCGQHARQPAQAAPPSQYHSDYSSACCSVHCSAAFLSTSAIFPSR